MTDEDTIDTVEMPVEAAPEPEPLTAEDIKLVVQGTQALQQALNQDPSLTTQVEIVIREHAHEEPKATTMRTLYQGLKLYISEEALDYLLGILINSDDPRYIEQAEIQAARQTWVWLRRLIALYGAKIREANALVDANPDAWRIINRRAFFDTVTHTWGVSLDIQKYNGERLVLDEVPGSALLLAEAIVDTLNNIPPEVAPDLLAPVDIQRFVEKCAEFADLFAPGMFTQGAEDEGARAEEEEEEEEEGGTQWAN